MALGVLNNLSAIYAENNLNNTNNSLQKVLQQLSSGSRINSGADDAAGLSLVNGLGANSAALTQSITNATEGVGLLQVADGALSQVTNLLNRAITLATEASNGTLNSTQESAANQEYQSILAEINNIGQTTTYNQEQVFNGTEVAIYTGDSSMAGSSIDNLYIRSLSQSSVGDTGGKMSYSSGSNSVFVNLSTGAQNAKATDTLNSNGVTTINVNYLVKGANGTGSTASTAITVGTGTSYANTANGLISAINNAGLGMTASFTTQASAGVTGGGTHTGIQIAGGLVSVGIDPNSVSTSGVINPTGIPASELLTQGQIVTVKVGGVTAGAVTISPTVNTLAELAGAINGFAGAPVTATVITNGDGTQSLSLADAASGAGALSVTTTAGIGALDPVFSVPSTAADAVQLNNAVANITGTAAVIGRAGSLTLAMSSGVDAATDLVSGSLVLTNGTVATPGAPLTFVMGAGVDGGGTYYSANYGTHASTLGNLANMIQARFGGSSVVAASAGSSGLIVTSATQGNNISIVGGAPGNTLMNANAELNLYSPTQGGAASTGTDAVTHLGPAAGGTFNVDDVIGDGTGHSGSIVLTNGTNTGTFTMNGTTNTWADLALAIQNSNLGVNVSTDVNGLVLTSAAEGATAVIVAVGAGNNTLKDQTDANAAATILSHTDGALGTPATYGTGLLAITGPGQAAVVGTIGGGDTITGSIVLRNGGGTAQTFVMGGGALGTVGNVTTVQGNSIANLMVAINSAPAQAVLHITASAGASGGLYLQSSTPTSITVVGTPTLADAIAETTIANPAGQIANPGTDSVATLGPTTGTVNTNDLFAAGGSIVLTNGAGAAQTFVVGGGTDSNVTHTYYTANHGDFSNTLANMAATINADSVNLALNALASTAGLTLNTPTNNGNAITVGANTLSDTSQGTYSSMTLGAFASESDTVTGTLSFSVGGSPESLSLTAGETVLQMINQINGTTAGSSTYPYGVTASWVPGSNDYGSVLLTSNAEGTAGQITTPVTSITDTTSTATLNFTAANAYNTGLSNSTSTATLYDSTTGQTHATFVANTTGANAIATISYTDGAGQSLSSTDLLNQADAETALNDLNVAINDVASMDGYIGAQINTLNSISQVMSTQQENVVSAQNAIQATDYASATSNMSKYEILSQTGIAALAQANSVEQEVTKLLQ